MELNELQTMKNFFKEDKFARLAGLEIEEITPVKAVVSVQIQPEHLNANGSVQGGLLYTLADFTFAVLGNFLHPITVTQSGHIEYLRAASGRRLVATAKETERAGKNTVCEVVIRGEDGQIVCVCGFRGFIKETDRNELMKKFSKEE